MRLLDRFCAWWTHRRHVAHQRRLRKKRVVIERKPDPRTVISNRLQ